MISKFFKIFQNFFSITRTICSHSRSGNLCNKIPFTLQLLFQLRFRQLEMSVNTLRISTYQRESESFWNFLKKEIEEFLGKIRGKSNMIFFKPFPHQIRQDSNIYGGPGKTGFAQNSCQKSWFQLAFVQKLNWKWLLL